MPFQPEEKEILLSAGFQPEPAFLNCAQVAHLRKVGLHKQMEVFICQKPTKGIPNDAVIIEDVNASGTIHWYGEMVGARKAGII